MTASSSGSPSLYQRVLATHAPCAVIFIRLVVGGLFVSEGIQKFIYANENGVGRFTRIGIPFPEIMGPFVGAVEIGCGALLIIGLLTRLASISLLISMTVAFITTKISVFLGAPFLDFSLTKASYYGFWGMLHEGRTDLLMLACLLFLLIVGAGPCSLDRKIVGTSESPP